MDRAGSLQNLNDIVLPGPVGWWPLAPGWYVVIVILLIVLTWGTFRALRTFRRNTYRRQALRELAVIRQQDCAAVYQLPLLLKRTALAAWPRESVADLTGPDWHIFLDRTANMNLFSAGMGALLDRLSYAGKGHATLSESESDRVCAAVELWLRHHREEAA